MDHFSDPFPATFPYDLEELNPSEHVPGLFEPSPEPSTSRGFVSENLSSLSLSSPGLLQSPSEALTPQQPPLFEPSPEPSTSRGFVSKNLSPPSLTSALTLQHADLSQSINLPSSGESLHGGTVSFEHLLLEKLKQTVSVKSGRRRICVGAEVITSKEVIARKIEEENERENKLKKKSSGKKKNVDENNNDKKKDQSKNKQRKVKSKKQGSKAEYGNEESEEDDFNPESSDDDFNIEQEIQDVEAETIFLASVQNRRPALNDWVLVKFPLKKGNKMYVGQISGIDPCLEVRFARKKRGVEVFCWPQAEDISMVSEKEILRFLPPPNVDKRGKFRFEVSFDGLKIE
ncbi:hypothetical protein GE061_017195 [Apolygus lucorum]|uniref:Uncharacterized protein n=1 Tax=Apolygus lucorum TaxID=248454 RepID=A0A8S9XCE9_APOLU|nr:hypothetical protein GE061_017195 [Apolygus lucorum]